MLKLNYYKKYIIILKQNFKYLFNLNLINYINLLQNMNINTTVNANTSDSE